MTLEPWRVEASRVTYRDRWLEVVTERCRAADGRLLGDYHTLQYPDWVNVVALTEDGQVLLVREYRHARRSIAVGLPGGAISGAGESPLVAAQRELLEETGYAAERWIALGESAVNAATHSNLLWSFLALPARYVATPSWDENEDVQLEHMSFSDFLRWFGVAEEGQSLHLATALLALRFVLADRSEELRAVRVSALDALTGGDEGAQLALVEPPR